MKNHSNTLVTLLTASLIHEIHIAKTLLANQGIESYIINENIASTIGTAFVEGYKLDVDKADLVQAKKILAEVEKNNS
jgi:hypothetical protein